MCLQMISKHIDGTVVTVATGTPFTYDDAKADRAMTQKMGDMLVRGRIYSEECRRRGVKFLPKQVVRQLFAKTGIPDGVMFGARASDIYTLTS